MIFPWYSHDIPHDIPFVSPMRSLIRSGPQDQIDMASASQSRFRVLHEPRGRRKDDLLTKVAIDAATRRSL